MAYWASLKQLFLFFFIGEVQIFMSLGLVTGIVLWSCGVSCFPDFSCSLKYCIAILHCGNHHLLQSLFTDSGEEKPSLVPARDSVFLKPSMHTPVLTFLLPLAAVLKIMCLLLILQSTKSSICSLPFHFAKDKAKAQVCHLFLAYRFWLDFCACSLLPPLWVHTEILTQGVWGRGWSRQGTGIFVCQLWGINVPGSPRDSWMGFLTSTTVNRTFIPLMFSATPICFSPSLCPPQVKQLLIQVALHGAK